MQQMNQLREKLDDINVELLHAINRRGELVQQIGEIKQKQGIERFDPERERDMLNKVVRNNHGPFANATVEHIFKELFKASLELLEDDHRKELLVSRKNKQENTIVNIKGQEIGGPEKQFIVGPCAVESFDQVNEVAQSVKKQG